MQARRQPPQGYSKFEYTESGEEALDSVGVFAECGGQIGSFGEAEQVDGDVAEGGEMMGAAGLADATMVFAPVGVTNPMFAILDAPMTTPEGK